MYIIAEEFHFSGVLAVVSGGLFLSARRHEILSHRSRLQGFNVWEAVAFVLNSLVFILIGLEFPVIIKALGPGGIGPAIKYSLIIIITLIITRFASTFGASVFTTFISRFITTADPRPGWKAPLLLGWTGMRGVVSLAAALSIPIALHSGQPFPQRNLILFITFSVIIATLVVQGLTLPAFIKLVNMPDPDLTVSFEQQKQMVRKKLHKLSLQLLEDKYADKLKTNDMVKALQLRLTSDMELLHNWDKEGNRERAIAFYDDYRNVMANLMDEQRNFLRTINKKDNINDDIIREQMDLLDLEEEKLRRYFLIGEDEEND